MPIIIKDYTWDETASVLFITVPLKGIKKEKIDIFSTETYLKVCIFTEILRIFHVLSLTKTSWLPWIPLTD